MRSIKQTKAFKKDLARESKGKNRFILKEEFYGIVESLAQDIPLDLRYRDHALAGNLKDLRECHIRPDLLLLYQKVDGELRILRLERLGSHRDVLGIE